MSDELKENSCHCGNASMFIKIIFATFLGCILAILLTGAFAKSKMNSSPCPYFMHKMHMKKMMENAQPNINENTAPFAKKTDRD